MDNRESFGNSGKDPSHEILEQLRKRAETGFGPAQEILKHLTDEADRFGMSIDDYLEFRANFRQIIDQD